MERTLWSAGYSRCRGLISATGVSSCASELAGVALFTIGMWWQQGSGAVRLLGTLDHYGGINSVFGWDSVA